MSSLIAFCLLAVLTVGLAAPRAVQAAAGESRRGEVVYQRCLACHSLENNRVGPRHCGLFGRRAGTLRGYSYSTAMKNYGVIWNEKTLDHFLENPMMAVPGTKMAYAGVKDAQERVDLIEYLKKATRDSETCK